MKKLITLSLLALGFSVLTQAKSNANFIKIDESMQLTTSTPLFLETHSKMNTEEKFKNEKLALIYDVFHNTTRNTVEAYMKEKGFDDAEIEPAFDDYGELLSFMTQFGMVEVEYHTDGKVLNVVYTYSGAINNVFIEQELKENNYNAELKKFMAGANLDQEFKKNVWSKSGTKNRFVTSSIEAEKVGVVGYGILED